ncbi:MAG TPA: hypothetical protein VJN63_04210 [Thermoplasmata archaeon]|nr:hypothetical protein [Thermoplasmata archaeon]
MAQSLPDTKNFVRKATGIAPVPGSLDGLLVFDEFLHYSSLRSLHPEMGPDNWQQTLGHPTAPHELIGIPPTLSPCGLVYDNPSVHVPHIL